MEFLRLLIRRNTLKVVHVFIHGGYGYIQDEIMVIYPTL